MDEPVDEMMDSSRNHALNGSSSIVFFDGVCGLCNGFVDFLVTADTQQRLKFASLQGETSKKVLPAEQLDSLDTIVFYSEGRFYHRSTAALKILIHLSSLWKAAALLLIVPRPFRDAIYNWVSNRRYRWFGKLDSCRLPKKEELSRFLP